MNENLNDYKGFSLFSDIEDAVLRTRNRAVVLCNIAEDHTKQKLISPKGASLILGYFSKIPDNEKLGVKERFSETMIERGYKLGH